MLQDRLSRAAKLGTTRNQQAEILPGPVVDCPAYAPNVNGLPHVLSKYSTAHLYDITNLQMEGGGEAGD
jgi:hypothetical protein